MNSSPDRFATGPSQSPRLQHPSQSSSAPFSGSSPKGASPKAMEPSQQKHKQISPQQALYRHLQGSEGNQQQIELGGQSRLQHLISGNAVDVDQGKPPLSGQGDGNFPYNPFQSGPRPPMAIHQNSPQAGYNSQQFQNPQYSAFNGGMPGGVDHKDMYATGNQHPTPQQPGYPFTNLQISDPQDLMQVKTSALLLQMQRIQQQIQQMREMGQPAQMQQLQFQFQRLYQFYVLQQQQQQRVQPNFQPQNYDQLRFLQQQRQQEKATRIAVEAMAKAALHSTEGMPSMPGFPQMSSGQRMMANPSGMNTGMVDLSRHPKPVDPINLGPSIVSKPAPVRSSQTSRCFFKLIFLNVLSHCLININMYYS